jgi:hypothetical protein
LFKVVGNEANRLKTKSHTTSTQKGPVMKRNFWKKVVSQPKAPRKRKVREKGRLETQPAVEVLERRELMTVINHGGGVLPHVEVQGFYYGSDWHNYAAGMTQAGQLDAFLNYIVNSPYMDMLTNAGYGISRGSSDPGQILLKNINKTSDLTDAQIRSDLQAQVTAGALKNPDTNRVFVVFVEPGVAIKASNGMTSLPGGFLGYHDAFAGRDYYGNPDWFRYAVIAYPGGYNPSPTSLGFRNSFDEITKVTSHELAETATDPYVSVGYKGWYDDSLHQEIGDIAERYVCTLNGYCVQDQVDQHDNLIAPQGATGYAVASTTSSASTTMANASSSAAANLDATAGGVITANGSMKGHSPSDYLAATDHVFKKYEELWID